VNSTLRTLLIVDDEAPARQRLERLVGEIPGWTCRGSCASGQEAITRAESERPAVVLRDMRMPGMDGIEVARHLGRLEQPPAVIFTTAYDRYAVDAFDSRAVGYLLKPVRRERLESTLAHAARVSDALLRELGDAAPGGGQRRHIAVRERGALRLIPLPEVWYFRAEQKYVSVGHAGGEDLIEESLRQLEQEFDDGFVRIHRSVLVAVDAIERLDRDAEGAYQVSLRGLAGPFPVSRRQLQQVKARIASGR
jgi:two-component system response regulator AlgR